MLESNNVGFEAKDIPHGRQYRFKDGAIANVYDKGTIVWQGKETETTNRVRKLCGEGPADEISSLQKRAPKTISQSNNKVFIVYGHDIACREQLELLLRRMRLEPVILQNLPIAGDTIIGKLESNIDVRYACVLLTPDD